MNGPPLHARPGQLVIYGDLRIQINADFNRDDNGRPYVSIDTSEVPAKWTYDEKTGLPGDARPYTTAQIKSGCCWCVNGPDGRVALFDQIGDEMGYFTRTRAEDYAKALNDKWSEHCGMPIIAVHLNDGAEIYDDDGTGNAGNVWVEKAKIDALEEIVKAVDSGAWDNDELAAHVAEAIQKMKEVVA